MKSNPEVFETRPGTRALRDEYKDKMAAHFSLLLAQDTEVLDFNISSNDENYGNFDDLVMQVDYREDDRGETAALQLKLHHEEKQPSASSFLDEEDDLNLFEYFKETEEMNISEEASLVLLTNHKFEVELKIKTTDESGIETEFQLEIFQPLEEDQPNLVKFISSNTCGQVVQYKVRNICEEHEKFENFLQRIYFCSSEDVEVVETKLREQFLEQTAYEQFVKFVENLSKNEDEDEGNTFELNKEIAISKFMECLLSPYASTSCLEIPGQDDLFDKLFSEFDVAIFEEFSHFVRGYDTNFIDRKKAGITCMNEKQFGLSKETDAIKLLWHLKELPLIIKSDCPKDILSKILNLGKDDFFGRRFVVIGKIDEEFKNINVLRDLSDLFDKKLVKLLENCKINLQGREWHLLEYVKDDNEMAKLFRTGDIATFLTSKKPLFLGENIRETFPYINRLLQTPVIKLEILESSPTDMIVISCKGRKAFLENLAESAQIILFEDSCSSQEFLEICSKHENQSVHHLQITQKGNLSWITTKGQTENLMKYLSEEDESMLDCEIFDNFPNKINVVCAKRNIKGKSALREFVTRNCPKNLWPILINLREFKKIFNKEPKEILAEIMDSKYKQSDLTKSIVNLMDNRKNILLLFDGLDEIAEESVEGVIKAMKVFSESEYLQWVTCRSNLKSLLECEFQVLAFNLTHLDEKNQRAYLRKWLNCDDEREDEIMTHLKNSLHRDMLGIPLLLFMLMEIHKDDKFSQDFLTLTAMYRKFLDTKFEPPKCQIANELERQLEKRRQKQRFQDCILAGVLVCFGENVCKELKIDLAVLRDFFDYIEKNGDERGLILGLVQGNIPVFVDRTYAQYFAALYLEENIDRIENFPAHVLAPHTIRFMLDLLLANGSKPHIAVIYGNVEMIEESETVPKDLIGRTPADLACIYNDSEFYYELPQSGHSSKMYKVEFDIEIWDNNKKNGLRRGIPTEFYNTNPDFDIFRYSEKIKSLYPLEILLKLKSCEIYHNKIKSLSIFREYVCTFILCCVRNNYVKLFSLLEVIPPMEIEIRVESGYTERIIKENTLLHLIARLGINEKKLRLTNLDGHSGNDCLMRAIAEIGININIKNEKGDTALLLACHQKENSKDVALSLIKSRADVNAQNKLGDTALIWASHLGFKDVVLSLLTFGADVNAQNGEGDTALLRASNSGFKDIVLSLIAFGADVNVQTEDGNTALFWASKRGYEDVVLSLIQCGADVNVQNKKGETALLWASTSDHRAAPLIYIMQYDADGNAYDEDSTLRFKRIVLALIESGADVNAQYKDGATVLFWASYLRFKDGVLSLIKRGADVNAQNKDGDTALLRASESGSKDVVLTLLVFGADVNARNKNGVTALVEAQRRGYKDIVKILVANGAR